VQRNEQLEGVLGVGFSDSSLDLLLDLLLALLSVTAIPVLAASHRMKRLRSFTDLVKPKSLFL
jgi:hypothetical protein